jgi:hypothetical protein
MFVEQFHRTSLIPIFSLQYVIRLVRNLDPEGGTDRSIFRSYGFCNPPLNPERVDVNVNRIDTRNSVPSDCIPSCHAMPYHVVMCLA